MPKLNRSIQNKKEWKDAHPKCMICGNDERETLEVHRITPGKDGGKYNDWNCVSCCGNCHAKIHAHKIKLIGKFTSTSGVVLIAEIDGKEEIIPL
jgi:5-methylcytosine-specific restriction endonuclease McrA